MMPSGPRCRDRGLSLAIAFVPAPLRDSELGARIIAVRFACIPCPANALAARGARRLIVL